MDRMLDTLYAAGVTREARKALSFPARALHTDATSFHVHEQYEGLGEEVGAIPITRGYSRDHRPHLKQGVMNLVCANTGGIPLRFAPGTETSRTGRPWYPRTLEGFSWILRVPATLREARALLEGEFPRDAWTPLRPGPSPHTFPPLRGLSSPASPCGVYAGRPGDPRQLYAPWGALFAHPCAKASFREGRSQESAKGPGKPGA